MEFIRGPRQSRLAEIIAQLQANSNAPIAQGIASAGNSIGEALAAIGQHKAAQGQQANALMAALAEKGMLEPTTGTVQNGQRVMDGGSPGSLPLADMFPGLPMPKGARYKPGAKATDNDLMPVTAEALKNYPALAKLGLKEGQKVPTSFMIAHTKPESPAGKIKPPPGYRFSADGTELEVIPGGPADEKQRKANEKDAAAQQGALQQADLMIQKVDQALKNVSGWSTGWGAAAVGWMPGSQAKDLHGDIETIKANLGFSQLAEMRKASPTGGALGAVSEREMSLLTSARASLDQAQSRPQIEKHLNEIKDHYMKWRDAVNKAKTEGAAGAGAGWSDADEKRLAELEARAAAKRTKR